MKMLKDMIKQQNKRMALLVFFAFIAGTMIIAQAYLLVTIIEDAFLGDADLQDVLSLLGILLLVLLFRTGSTYLSGRTGVKMGAQAKAEFRHALLHQYKVTPVQASITGQSGGKVSLLMDAVDEVENYFSSYIPQVIQSSLIPLLILIVVFTQHLNSGLIMLITSPFIPIFMIIIGMQTQKKSEEQLDKLASFSGGFLDTLQGLTTLKLFGRAKKQKQTIEKSSLGFRDATMEILKVAFTSSFMLELISMLSIGIIALEIALQLILFDGITFFVGFLILILAPEYYTSLKELGSAFHNGQSSIGAAKKVAAELEEEDKVVTWGEKEFSSEGKPPQLELQKLGFSYGDTQFSLSNIEATIPAYASIAIVGKSGSGKSTLLHLLAGLLPISSGEIKADENSLHDYQEEQWFNKLSYISQHPYIFSGTVAENIAIGATDPASREDIQTAAEQAGLLELVQSLEKGLDTPVGEAGRGLSGGEKQRLALARAFLKQPSLILFDEPTTGLDLKTERILQKSIETLSKNATIITVAHRLHTIKNADLIIFLEDGKMAGKGTHTELVANLPAYADMVSVQQGGTA
ncbi:thiol reductant ABC exporter subunit CydD [Oceanobacillus kapialis]|uniref:Thiol reductant ABC exporter subunit CydD n=1 Tax=Oceanobacillus kapialis TaxID=481353 RepID=A0ABW5Q432_9BACI